MPSGQTLRFLFFGAGAIGTYIGGSLALAGFPVAFVEQPGPAERLRANGLRLNIGGRFLRVPAPVVHSTPEAALRADPPDLVVFALKSYDTAAAVDSLRPWKPLLPPALCLQNGVENEGVLEEVFGAGRVIAGTVTSAVGRGEAGEITLERKRGVGIALGHPFSRAAAAACAAAGLKAGLFADGPAMKWSKLLTNLAANASAAILGMPPAEIFADPGLNRMEIEMLRECLRVMRALNRRPVDLPGTPVRLFAFAVERLPPALARPALAHAIGGGRGGKMPSLYLDLHSGRGQSEVGWLNGAVVRFGGQLGVATPVNRMLTETLETLAAGREDPQGFIGRPERLLERLPG
jgi:2-dehydropantoate 2-reductase